MLLEGRTIGLVEDDPVMGGSLVQSLTLEGCRVEWWKTRAEAEKGIGLIKPDLVICDMRLPDGYGDKMFYSLAAREPLPPFLFITAFADIDQAVAVMRAGASDYVTKPFEITSFMERARALMARASQVKSEHVLGVSEGITAIEDTIQSICDGINPVLIVGETGVGKEVCARLLHEISVRSKEPFIAVNCAAIPAEVIERELFGYRGASGQAFHHGLAERTRGGVLFLDEVSELSLQLQAKLLRLVEVREYHRVSGEQLIQFRGRIVCSTNRDLAEMVVQKRFRADLYYCINGLTLSVPPLRMRRDDIPWLINHFFNHFRGAEDTIPRGVSTLAYEAAQEHAWPGNVLELRNRMERAMALTKTEWIMPSDLFPDLTQRAPVETQKFATLTEARDLAERRQIERALKETNGQINEAARLLGISRTTLWDKMRRLNVATPLR